ncbi:MAG: amidohydrolase family protein [Chloroflexota bacterium]|nr:amidohydrolase family protein [Chloroflexota bacterium]
MSSSAADLSALARPPFAVRGRLLTPLDGGGTSYLADGVLAVGSDGRIAWSSEAAGWPTAAARRGVDGSLLHSPLVDLRPQLLLPGLIDLHAHLPQLPNAGLGAGLDLLAWLERYIFPLERDFDEATAERVAPAAYRAFAAAGTTTVVLYGAVYEPSIDVSFRAAEEHGIRAVIGKVMMDRLRYDPAVPDNSVLELSLRQTAELIARWHGHDGGRLRYAVTPRFAVSCSADMLRESAALARSTGTYWQTHLAEDRHEIEEVGRIFPDALDYTDVYDRAGGLGRSAILAHAVHLTDREVARLAESGSRIAHCPSSNLFLSSGAMPLSRYLDAGLVIGLGSDVAGGPDVSLFSVMRAGAYTQSGLRTMLGEKRPSLAPLDWLRLATLEAARVLGLEREIGSLEAGKEADFICVDPRVTAPVPGQETDDPSDLMSRLIYRTRPEMVRGAWVRGRRLPAGRA